MSAVNDITGDRLVTKPSAKFNENIDKVDMTWIREQVAKREQRNESTTRSTQAS